MSLLKGACLTGLQPLQRAEGTAPIAHSALACLCKDFQNTIIPMFLEAVGNGSKP